MSVNENDELQDLWHEQSDTVTRKGEDMLALVIEKTRTLDRQVIGRNTRECLAALLVTAIFSAMAWHASNPVERLGWAVTAASGIWIVFYLLRFGKGPGRPDRGATVASYTALLAANYDRQIRLLGTVKYWYLLPLWLGIAIAMFGQWLTLRSSGHAAFAPVISLAIATVVFIAVWLLNEKYGVGYLRREKQELPAAAPEHTID